MAFLAALAIALLALLSGCQVVDPLIASGRFEVQAEGGAEIEVQLVGGADVSRIRQQDIINDFMLDLSRDPARESAVFDARLELEGLFELNGYPLVEVEHEIAREDDLVRVQFAIDPGPLVILRNWQIRGNTAADRDTLGAYLPTRKSDVLSRQDHLFVFEDLETMRRGILGHYERLGHLDAEVKIIGPEPKLSRESRYVSVTVEVQEGPEYTVDQVVVEAQIAALLGADQPTPPEIGSTYGRRSTSEYALQITRYLRARGHTRPEIRSVVEKMSDSASVVIRLTGEPGKPTRVRRIGVRGNTYVTTGRIMERIELEEGKHFDGDREDQSLLRLYRTGQFQGVEPVYEQVDDDTIDVIFDVEETTRYLIEPMIGWGSYENLRGGLEFHMLSVLGTGFDFSTSGTVSDKGHRAVATLAESDFWPALFGGDSTTLGLSVDDFRRVEPFYTDGATGVTPSLAHIFNREWSARIGYTFREHADARSTVIDPGAQIGRYTEGSTAFELAYDSRDNPIMPKRGNRLAVQHQWFDDSLGGDVAFQQVRLFGTTVLPVTATTRFVLRSEISLLYPESSFDKVPIQERLFNGGETTVRSYREDQLAPAELRDINGMPSGGAFRNVLNAEFRWAPPLQPFDVIELELALFGDAGNLGRSANDYTLNDLKYGVGAGLRLLLPIGPVRFDAAHNPERDPGDRDWTFHFSVGHAF